MAQNFLSKDGLTKLWGIIASTFVAKEEGKGLFSGKYGDLTGTPTKLTDFTNDLDFISATDIADTYLSKTDAASTYVTITDYNAKVAELVQADTDNLAAAKKYGDDTFVTITAYDTKVAALEKADSDNLQAAKDYADAAVGAITGFDFQVVDALPGTGVKGVIYLVAATGDANVETDNNVYDEYIWITDKFEHIGSTKMDLTGYLKEIDIVAITNDEIDQICVL